MNSIMIRFTVTPNAYSPLEIEEQAGSLEELLAWLATHEVGDKEGPAIVPAILRPCPIPCRNTGNVDCGGGKAHLLGDNVEAMTGFAADLDEVAPEVLEKLLAALTSRRIAFAWWHTHSFGTKPGARARIFVPFAAPLAISDAQFWSAKAWPALVRELGLEGRVDTACKDPRRIYYLPRKPTEDSPHRSGFALGALFDPTPVIGRVPERRELPAAPAVARVEESGEPVDLSDVAARLAERARLRPDLRPIVENLLAGKPLTSKDGEREPTWLKATDELAWVAEPGDSSEQLLELLRPSWEAEEAERPHNSATWEHVASQFKRDRPRIEARKVARASKDAEASAQFGRLAQRTASLAASGGASTTGGASQRETPQGLGALWKSVGEWSSGGDWFTVPPPERQYLLTHAPQMTGAEAITSAGTKSGKRYGVLPLGKVGMLSAGGGSGKSLLLLQLALSVVTGRRFLGLFEVLEGPVAYLAGEEEIEELRRRVFRLVQHMKLTKEETHKIAARLHLVPLCGIPVALTVAADEVDANELPETPFVDEILGRLDGAHVDWRLVILDPLARFAGPDVEINNAQATRFVQVLEKLPKVRGTPTLLFAHHTTKEARKEKRAGEATNARGASALTDGVRWQANLDPLEVKNREAIPFEYARFEVTKSNYGRRPPRLHLVNDFETVGGFRRATPKEDFERDESNAAEGRAEQHRKAYEKGQKKATRERLGGFNYPRNGAAAPLSLEDDE